ncbi:MAG: FMN-binding protein [Ruthenibacterium sp.]
MKKILVIALACILALSLVACGGGIKDGTYTAEAAQASHDWFDILSVTYKDGKVVEAVYDAKDAAGVLKSSKSAEEYPMEIPLTEWMPKLNENIVKAGTADKIEAVAGATNSSNAAKALMKAIEENAKKGNTETAKVTMPTE